MIVTEKLLNRIQRGNGGYTRVQIETLGLQYPTKTGWKKLVVGRDITNWRTLFTERDRVLPTRGERKRDLKQRIIESGVLEVSHSDTWRVRNEKLNISYKEYLNSDHWRNLKKTAAKRPNNYGSCRFCGCTKNIELHHKTYRWIMTPYDLSTIVPLCRTHHQEVHDYAKENNLPIEKATSFLTKKYMNKNKLGVENSLVNNINAKKKSKTSKPKSKSTVSKEAYDKMKKGWK